MPEGTGYAPKNKAAADFKREMDEDRATPRPKPDRSRSRPEGFVGKENHPASKPMYTDGPKAPNRFNERDNRNTAAGEETAAALRAALGIKRP